MYDILKISTQKPNSKLSSDNLLIGNQKIVIGNIVFKAFANSNTLRDFEVGKGGTKSVVVKLLAIEHENIRKAVDNIIDWLDGKVYLIINDWYIEVDVHAIKFKNYVLDRRYIELEIILESSDWIWSYDHVIDYDPKIWQENIQGENWRDYELDNGKRGYNYGYTISSNLNLSIKPKCSNPKILASAEILLFGSATDPFVTIDNRKIGVKGSIADGEYIKIDMSEKKVTKYKTNGNTENMFAKRTKSEEYSIFDRIRLPCTVTAPKGLKFSAVITEHRRTPQWT